MAKFIAHITIKLKNKLIETYQLTYAANDEVKNSLIEEITNLLLVKNQPDNDIEHIDIRFIKTNKTLYLIRRSITYTDKKGNPFSQFFNFRIVITDNYTALNQSLKTYSYRRIDETRSVHESHEEIVTPFCTLATFLLKDIQII